MGILGKLFGEKAPDWAQPIGFEEFQEFQNAVLRTLASKIDEVDIDWQNGKLTTKDGSHHVYFHNLIFEWKQRSGQDRIDLVEKYFPGILNTKSPTTDELDLDRLLLRVYDYEGLKQGDFMTVYPIGKNLAVVLVLDGESSVVTVKKEIAESSGKSLDELLEIAKTNLTTKVPYDARTLDSPMGPLTIITAEVFGGAFISAMNVVKPSERYLVASPTRDLCIYLKPNEWSKDTLLKFLETAAHFSRQSPRHYIFPFVLEYCDGVYTDLCIHENNQMRLRDDITFE